MVMDVFTAESALLRTEKLVLIKSEDAAQVQILMARTYLSDALERIHLSGKHAITGFAEGDELRMLLIGIKRFTKYQPFNTIAARQIIADKMIAANKYPF
jgi:hypothetical protein